MQQELDRKLLSVGRLDECGVQVGAAEAVTRTQVVDTLGTGPGTPRGFVMALSPSSLVFTLAPFRADNSCS